MVETATRTSRQYRLCPPKLLPLRQGAAIQRHIRPRRIATWLAGKSMFDAYDLHHSSVRIAFVMKARGSWVDL
jgi:hypothetical protein